MASTGEPELFPTQDPGLEPADLKGRPACLFADVAVNRPMRREYTYSVPAHLEAAVAPGMRVSISFAGRRQIGVIVGLRTRTEVALKRLKPIAELLDTEPVLDEELLELTRWMASYYGCSWGEALAAVLPAALKREGGRRTVVQLAPAEGVGAEHLVEIEDRHPKQHRLLRTLLDASGPVERKELLRRLGLSESPVRSLQKRGWIRVEHVYTAPDALLSGDGVERAKPDQLTADQENAVATIRGQLHAREFATVLLRGVTGSGKTEVYLRVIEEALGQGRGAIVLVPEISLTPQTVGWFRARFGDVAVLHSRMTDVQRLEMWHRVRRGECRVVVGARSAVFAPVSELGVIVVDEEHEPSFKQGNTPRYHGRDVAVMRARGVGAVCILGSATPSLESLTNADRGRYGLIELTSRVHGGPMPGVEIVDMRKEMAETKQPAVFSRKLRQELARALGRGEQGILFLNRRGHTPVLWCKACGETVRCDACAVPMAFHRRRARVVCHTCCDEQRPPESCPSCTAPALRFIGVGSEKIEDDIRVAFPEARVGRMDSDTMLRREDYENTLTAFGRGELDLLVGTQMIAKGLDFPRVTVVGIISADSALYLPDFRASERTFQLISQVAGRAGRGEFPGHIIIQTVTPEHHAIVHAARYDYQTFMGIEARQRSELSYPPFGRLIRVVFEDEDEQLARDTASRIALAVGEELRADGVMVLGPAPAPLSMIRGRHRLHVLVKAPEQGTGAPKARALLARLSQDAGRTRVTVDVDPVSML